MLTRNAAYELLIYFPNPKVSDTTADAIKNFSWVHNISLTH